MPASNYLATSLLKHLLRIGGTTFYPPTGPMRLALGTGIPTPASFTEIAGDANYHRRDVAFPPSTLVNGNYVVQNPEDVDFGPFQLDWTATPITCFAIFDGTAPGNLLVYGLFGNPPAPVPVPQNSFLKVRAESVTISLINPKQTGAWDLPLLQQAVLEHVFRGTMCDRPADLYVALSKTSPSTAAFSEPSGASYDRVHWTDWTDPAAAGGTPNKATNGSSVEFKIPLEDWTSGAETLNTFGIFDAPNPGSGNLLFWGGLDAPSAITAGQKPTLNMGIDLDPPGWMVAGLTTPGNGARRERQQQHRSSKRKR